jgi:hypothetical protein
MLFLVDHHLGDSRKSAPEAPTSRLLCFTTGFPGPQTAHLFSPSFNRSNPVHRCGIRMPENGGIFTFTRKASGACASHPQTSSWAIRNRLQGETQRVSCSQESRCQNSRALFRGSGLPKIKCLIGTGPSTHKRDEFRPQKKKVVGLTAAVKPREWFSGNKEAIMGRSRRLDSTVW